MQGYRKAEIVSSGRRRVESEARICACERMQHMMIWQTGIWVSFKMNEIET